MIEATSAITLATHDMPRAVRFYRSLGFEIRYGGETAPFTSFCAGPTCLNLIAQGEDKQWSWWGRVIFHVSDVDAVYEQALQAGHSPSTTPRDAEWGERYFHLTDPDGHELSFARPLRKSGLKAATARSPLGQNTGPQGDRSIPDPAPTP